jgi:hypothetical protein
MLQSTVTNSIESIKFTAGQLLDRSSALMTFTTIKTLCLNEFLKARILFLLRSWEITHIQVFGRGRYPRSLLSDQSSPIHTSEEGMFFDLFDASFSSKPLGRISLK